MATNYNFKDTSKIITINEFHGLNQDESGGETQINLSESPDMMNYRITKNYALRKRDGYRNIFKTDLADSPINGMYYCRLNNEDMFLFSHAGKLKRYKFDDKSVIEIGNLADNKCSFFFMKDKLYILDGSDYKSFDGTTLKSVEGTIPEVLRGGQPSGGGESLDQINALNPKRKAIYSSDGTAKDYHLPETDLQSIVEVRVDNVITTAYTSNLGTGVITFNSAPRQGIENVEIIYEIKHDNRTWITKCRFGMLFGGNNDTRVFLWGNPDSKNARIRSAVFDPEYYPVNDYDLIGSDEEAITDIVRVNDTQVIYKEKSCYFARYQQAEIKGVLTGVFPTYNLNGVIGNVAFGQVQIIQESPFSLQHGVQRLTSAQVRDEKNVDYISGRVKATLDNADLKNAITFDFQAQKEYMVNVGKVVWVYNYDNDSWYAYNNIEATCFININDVLYFGDKHGKINEFRYKYTDDNLDPINAYWKSGFSNLQIETQVKYLAETWLTLKPEVKSHVTFTWRTNKKSQNNEYDATYSFANFDSVDFADWSFETNYNPQPFRFKTKAKKFAYIQFILKCESATQHSTVLELNVRVRAGSKIK